MIRLREMTKDGTPYAVKVACTVWSGGKFSDYLKELPITIKENIYNDLYERAKNGEVGNNILSVD